MTTIYCCVCHEPIIENVHTDMDGSFYHQACWHRYTPAIPDKYLSRVAKGEEDTLP